MSDIKSNMLEFLLKPKVVRASIIGTIIVFLPGILIALLVANLNPGGYNIIDNYISNLGGVEHTTAPWLFNGLLMISSALMLPTTIYMYTKFRPISKIPEGKKDCFIKNQILALLGFSCMFIGIIGQFMVGVFNEDIHTPHVVFAAFGFGGLMIAGLFYGLLISFYDTLIPKFIGLFMSIVPILMGLFTGLGLPPSQPFWEWMSLFAINFWLITVSFYLIKDLNKG